ncbi:MAG: MBL fold metallo-hydrolase [Chloroflexota bacterium]
MQYAPTANPPSACPICLDERQYVGWSGQQWTTLEELRGENRHNTLQEISRGLLAVATTPAVAIGQRALIAQTSTGNVMWDCITFVDAASVRALSERGGLRALAISHPHFYASMVEWSRAFDNCPIYIHAADAEWIQYPVPQVELWNGQTLDIGGGATLINTGGHFEGSTAMHWAEGADGAGVLLVGDSLTVVMDRRYVSFMYSFPNLIPLPRASIERIVDSVRPFAFERIYGAWNGRDVTSAGRDAVDRSAARYIHFLERLP